MGTIVFDDCYLCNWMMSDGLKRGERWCGAGRSEFNTGENCPTRSERVERSLTGVDHIAFWDSNIIHGWLKTKLPETRYYVLEGTDLYTVLDFASLTDAAIFMLNWNHVYRTNKA